jgi:hypothetical protein
MMDVSNAAIEKMSNKFSHHKKEVPRVYHAIFLCLEGVVYVIER